MAHTPGPWPYDYVYTAVRHIVRNCDDLVGSHTMPDFSWDRYEDAALIAAAPDLLAALREVLDDEPDVSDEVLRRAEAAIAKTEPASVVPDPGREMRQGAGSHPPDHPAPVAPTRPEAS